MDYSSLLDFDLGFLPLDYWDYNPAWDVDAQELEDALDLENEMWYNEDVDIEDERIEL